MVNHYETLGVTEQATSDEIKAAFRKLAMSHHPDRGGDAEKFKQINEANTVLSDPQKRQQYDMQRQYGHHSGNDFSFTGGGMNDLHDFIRAAMGGHPFARPRQATRNRDIQVGMEISLLESIHGVDKVIQYKTNANGEQFNSTLFIPAGLPDGATVHFPNLGDNTYKELPRGDLLLHVRIRPHPNFILDGPHLHTEIIISAWTAMLGGVFEFNTIENNKLNINVPEGMQPGTVMRIAGHGGTDYHSKKRGDCFVKIQVDIPHLSTEQKEIVRKLAPHK